MCVADSCGMFECQAWTTISFQLIQLNIACTVHMPNGFSFIFWAVFRTPCAECAAYVKKWELVWSTPKGYELWETKNENIASSTSFVIYSIYVRFAFSAINFYAHPSIFEIHINSRQHTHTHAHVHWLSHRRKIYKVHAHDTIMARPRTHSSTFRVKKKSR